MSQNNFLRIVTFRKCLFFIPQPTFCHQLVTYVACSLSLTLLASRCLGCVKFSKTSFLILYKKFQLPHCDSTYKCFFCFHLPCNFYGAHMPHPWYYQLICPAHAIISSYASPMLLSAHMPAHAIFRSYAPPMLFSDHMPRLCYYQLICPANAIFSSYAPPMSLSPHMPRPCYFQLICSAHFQLICYYQHSFVENI